MPVRRRGAAGHQQVARHRRITRHAQRKELQAQVRARSGPPPPVMGGLVSAAPCMLHPALPPATGRAALCLAANNPPLTPHPRWPGGTTNWIRQSTRHPSRNMSRQ